MSFPGNVTSQELVWPFAQDSNSSRSDCLLNHTLQHTTHSSFVRKEHLGLRCAFLESGANRPTSYSSLETQTSSQSHLLNHSTLVPESVHTCGMLIYNGPNAQLDSLSQCMNTGSPDDHWAMQDHTGEVLGADGEEANGEVSKYAILSLVPQIDTPATTKPDCLGLDARRGSVAVDDRGMMAPTMKPPYARQRLEHTTHSCGWIKEDGTKCNTPITFDCARHLASAHGIRHRTRHLKITCRWCKPPKLVRRSSMLRHVREMHLNYPRASTCT